MSWNPFTRLSGRQHTAVASHEPGDESPFSVVEVESHPPAATAPSAASNSLPPSSIADVNMMGPIAVVTLTAQELCGQQGAEALSDLLETVVNAGAQHMVLDIQNVRFMDSACIGSMVEALNHLARSGGSIALANPASGVANLFRITRLDRVFPICADVLAAINTVERGLR